MKRIYFLFILAFVAISSFAHDVEIDGIYYNLTSTKGKEATVTFKGEEFNSYFNEYSGSVIIPSTITVDGVTYSVTSIGDWAFRGCFLTSVTFGNSVTSIGDYAFYYCSSLTSVTFGNSMTTIGNYAFYGCSGLTSVTIPNTVTSIGFCSFWNCSSLISVTIGNSVTSIGDQAFRDCSNLEEIHIQAIKTPTAYDKTFAGVSKDACKLYVPNGTKAKYAYAKGWKDFMNIIQEESTAITQSEIGNKFGDAEFYTLNGVKVDVPSKSGIYVVKKNGESKKVVVK